MVYMLEVFLSIQFSINNFVWTISFLNYPPYPHNVVDDDKLQLSKTKNENTRNLKKQLSIETSFSEPIDNVPFSLDGYQLMSYKNRKWIKIFEHNASFGFFTPENVALNKTLIFSAS